MPYLEIKSVQEMINIYIELINIELQINQGLYLFINLINYKIITKIIKN